MGSGLTRESALSWSDRLRGLLDDRTPAQALRVSRGRAYARSGRVSGLRAVAGLLAARVQGSRATPYRAEVGVPPLDAQEWGRIVRVLAGQAGHGARLLAGQVPEGVEDELERRGVRLFPHLAELDPRCTCDDPAPVCKHVAALVEVAAEALDRDPFLLFRLRGRGREALLADLSAARRGGADGITEPLADVVLAGWTTLRAPLPEDGEDAVWAAAERGGAAALLGGRSDPPGWAGGVPAEEVFGPLVARGRRWARERDDHPPLR